MTDNDADVITLEKRRARISADVAEMLAEAIRIRDQHAEQVDALKRQLAEAQDQARRWQQQSADDMQARRQLEALGLTATTPRDAARLICALMPAVQANAPPLRSLNLAVLLWVDDGPCAVSDLVHALGIPVATISGAVDDLADRTMVERVVDEHDRRRHLVTITAKGQRWLRSARRYGGTTEEG